MLIVTTSLSHCHTQPISSYPFVINIKNGSSRENVKVKKWVYTEEEGMADIFFIWIILGELKHLYNIHSFIKHGSFLNPHALYIQTLKIIIFVKKEVEHILIIFYSSLRLFHPIFDANLVCYV